MDTYTSWIVADVLCPCGPSTIAMGYGPARCNGCGTRLMVVSNTYQHYVKLTGYRGSTELTRAWPLRSMEGIPSKA